MKKVQWQNGSKFLRTQAEWDLIFILYMEIYGKYIHVLYVMLFSINRPKWWCATSIPFSMHMSVNLLNIKYPPIHTEPVKKLCNVVKKKKKIYFSPQDSKNRTWDTYSCCQQRVYIKYMILLPRKKWTFFLHGKVGLREYLEIWHMRYYTGSLSFFRHFNSLSLLNDIHNILLKYLILQNVTRWQYRAYRWVQMHL